MQQDTHRESETGELGTTAPASARQRNKSPQLAAIRAAVSDSVHLHNVVLHHNNGRTQHSECGNVTPAHFVHD